jgi:hypothetical protein
MRGFRGVALALVAALAIVLGVGLTKPAPARAWFWDPKVTIYGTLNVCGPGGIQTAYVRGNLNGTIVQNGTALGAPPSYSLTWNNVPSGGGYAWVVVNCSVTGSYGRWVHVYRPTLGNSLHVNLS